MARGPARDVRTDMASQPASVCRRCTYRRDLRNSRHPCRAVLEQRGGRDAEPSDRCRSSMRAPLRVGVRYRASSGVRQGPVSRVLHVRCRRSRTAATRCANSRLCRTEFLDGDALVHAVRPATRRRGRGRLPAEFRESALAAGPVVVSRTSGPWLDSSPTTGAPFEPITGCDHRADAVAVCGSRAPLPLEGVNRSPALGRSVRDERTGEGSGARIPTSRPTVFIGRVPVRSARRSRIPVLRPTGRGCRTSP